MAQKGVRERAKEKKVSMRSLLSCSLGQQRHEKMETRRPSLAADDMVEEEVRMSSNKICISAQS